MAHAPMTVVETAEFMRKVKSLLSESERAELVAFIAANPEVGEIIPETGGLRKIRWALPGMGKRGGARVIYFNRLESGWIALVIVYAKAKFDNLPASVLKTWKDAIDESLDQKTP